MTDSESMPDLFEGDARHPPAEGAPERRQDRTLAEVQRLLKQIADARQAGVHLEAACNQALRRMNEVIAEFQARATQSRLAYFHDLGRGLQSGGLKKRQKALLLDGLFHLACVLEDEHDTPVWDELCRYSGKPREYFLDEDVPEGHPDFESLFGEFLKDLPGGGSEEEADASAEEERPRRGRKKSDTKKPDTKAASRQASLLGDIRTLYLMLARALHPDKESDPSRRREKTGWMQQVTTAYAEKNLGQLLDILVRNPLQALGPFLETTPEATLRGFAKRLRKELQGLTRQTREIFRRYPPGLESMFTLGNFDERSFKAWERGLKSGLKALKTRERIYHDIDGVLELLAMSRVHGWDALL